MELKNMMVLAIALILSAQQSMAIETTLDMVIKADKEINKLRSDMKAKCELFQKTLDEEGNDLFKVEQSVWLKLVEAKAEFAADKYRGGSLARVVRLHKVIAEYQTRIIVLEEYIQNYHKP